MDATTRRNRNERRGVVLVLVLAMLGLLAVIGVSFATFSGQARYAARIYSQKLATPRPEDVLDFGIGQLINDTTNPMSALYGHGLKRDMYGSDGYANGVLFRLPNGLPIAVTNVVTADTDPDDGQERWVVDTNIPISLGLDFTRWSAITQPNAASLEVRQTLEVTGWSAVGTAPNQTYRLQLYGSHVVPAFNNGYTLAEPVAGRQLVLDGRFLRAFNGTGIALQNGTVSTGLANAGQPGNSQAGQYANFRLSGGLLTGNPNVLGPFNPNAVPMDEDYDAPDLENWFLAAQSADGQVIIPSFHRPGILVEDVDPNTGRTLDDWKLRPNTAPNVYERIMAIRAMSKILRPRAVDHPSAGARTFPDLKPDPATGKITYDVDNDGDGITDSVWLDLGYPAIRSPEGKLYKPLFSFMVLGLNGRIPLNTAGNLNARATVDDPATTVFNEAGMPLFDHASHLGYSPSEINPKFVLQNGYSPAFPLDPNTNDANQSGQHQFDNTGIVPVNLTQLRNILGGTRLASGDSSLPGDNNVVVTRGRPFSLPNNMADPVDLPDAATSAIVPRMGPAVPGRWGEASGLASGLTRFNFAGDPAYIPPYLGYEGIFRGLSYESVGVAAPPYNAAPTPILAGRSPFANQQYRVDGIDENYDGIDFFPQRFQAGVQPNPLVGPERGDPADPFNWANRFSALQDLYVPNAAASGLSLLPSERIRHFVTPIDPTGNGQIVRYDVPPSLTAYYGFGPDRWGRVSFFHYFRPPGVPQREDFFPNRGTAASPSYPLARNNLNKTRGYMTFANPGGANGYHMAAMPYNVSNASGAGNSYAPTAPPTDLFDPLAASPLYVGTFNEGINSNVDAALDPAWAGAGPNTTRRGFPFGGLRYNDPDEMNLYAPDGNDQPFGLSDLEWLLRRQDIDGTSLSSRLADLAPISLVQSPDALARSRMLTTESWDRISYSFPIDRPRGPTPSIAQGDRRINLNFPLPHSYDPYEPVRLKWISETYAFLKQVLPLTAIDTAEELAELGQFVVNIIDFRDPDNTITIWTNPDVFQTPARVITGTPERHLQPQIHLPRLPIDANNDGVNDPNPNLSADYAAALATPLVHFGMEYNPVAINEVLGFVYNYADPAKTGTDRNSRTSRLFIELVNMLTRDGSPGSPDPASLDLENWEFVLLKEDPNATRAAGTPYYHPAFVRPDPYTGQLPRPDTSVGLDYDPPTIRRVAVGTGLDVTKPNALDGLDTPIRGMAPDADNGNPKYYVLTGAKYEGERPDTSGNLRTLMNNDGQQVNGDKNFDGDDDGDGTAEPWDLVPDPNDPGFGSDQGLYYWLYLQRPANPLLPAGPNNPMVVVDSFRFPFGSSQLKGQTRTNAADPMDTEEYDQPEPAGPNPPNGATDWLYSVERRQPFRGGQLVPDLSDTTWEVPSYSYGFTEQARPSTSGELYGIYDTINRQLIDGTKHPQNTTDENDKVHTTGRIRNTLGGGMTGGSADTPWDYLAFNDRDFMSVAELALVPGCPPGMFTKKFVETSPPLRSPDPANEPGITLNATPPVTKPNFGNEAPGMSKEFNRQNTHTYPYLVDRFFYSGSTFGDGWHRVLEVFEVPVPSVGAIGPVAQGVNFDWYREDRRPGQVNLNLVMDEEVFFSVIDDPRLLNLSNYQTSLVLDAQLPRVVTQVNQYGTPKVSYAVTNRGFTTFTTDSSYTTVNLNPTSASFPVAGMKKAFADFLKLRHGGSGYLFGYGSGVTGTPFIQNPVNPSFDNPGIAADKPYRSLSYPDINQTVLRPASLPPSQYTLPPLVPATDPAYRPDVGDPGTRNAFFPRDARLAGNPGPTDRAFPAPVRPIPPRRLFQVPDSLLTGTNPGDAQDNNQSNASLRGEVPISDDLTNPTTNTNLEGEYPYLPTTTAINPLNAFPASSGFPQIGFTPTSDPVPNLFEEVFQHLGQHNIVAPPPPAPFFPPTTPENPAMFSTPPPASGQTDGTEAVDLRRHPQYRYEMLSKLMNLTTPRTHQFAVWLTVGYFEVVKPGDPSKLIPDELGRELGSASGSSSRFRAFYVVDRSRATGYDPLNPGDFREVILYSRRIE